MTLRLAVFDCDGTLIDSEAGIVRAVELGFADAGLEPPSAALVRGGIGLSVPEAMRRLAPDAEERTQAILVERYRTRFREGREHGAGVAPLFPGIHEALDAIEQAGWLFAVATGMGRRGLDAVLSAHGLAHRFVSLQTADSHPSKPDCAMLLAAMRDARAEADRTVMIGDSQHDMLMARQAGVHAVGVSWGVADPNKLRAAGAETVVPSPRELATLLSAP